MLTLVKEDGTGLENANSYASAADGDAYHDGHLYASDWTGASSGTKEKALVMATRLIDTHLHFDGYKTNSGQALMWPRFEVKDRDNLGIVVAGIFVNSGSFMPADEVPQIVIDATCEQARELIKLDRTAESEWRGIKRFRMEGVMQSDFDKLDRLPVLTDIVRTMLGKFTSFSATKSGPVPLSRT